MWFDWSWFLNTFLGIAFVTTFQGMYCSCYMCNRICLTSAILKHVYLNLLSLILPRAVGYQRSVAGLCYWIALPSEYPLVHLSKIDSSLIICHPCLSVEHWHKFQETFASHDLWWGTKGSSDDQDGDILHICGDGRSFSPQLSIGKGRAASDARLSPTNSFVPLASSDTNHCKILRG